MLGIRTIIMVEFSVEEKFIIDQLKENGGELDYKELQTLCQEEFEGVRLILKKLKENQIVRYEGVIPSYSAKIKLNEVL
jgi:hypothetical protein